MLPIKISNLIKWVIVLLIYGNFNFAYGIQRQLMETIEAVETDLSAKVGVAFLHEEQNWSYNGGEHFPLTSTFKALACAAVLVNVDTGNESLDRSILIKQDDMVPYAPITENHIGQTLSVAELCEAAITLSDNTAANLILETIDGPAGFTAFMQSIGDKNTQLSRWEPGLNEAIPGDLRDTTTPNAIVASLDKILFGEILSDSSKITLKNWLINDKVGDALIRSVLPAGWIIGDKTGAGGYGSRGIIAVLWPPNQQPIIISIYITQTEASFADRNAAIAKIGASIIRYVLCEHH